MFILCLFPFSYVSDFSFFFSLAVAGMDMDVVPLCLLLLLALLLMKFMNRIFNKEEIDQSSCSIWIEIGNFGLEIDENLTLSWYWRILCQDLMAKSHWLVLLTARFLWKIFWKSAIIKVVLTLKEREERVHWPMYKCSILLSALHYENQTLPIPKATKLQTNFISRIIIIISESNQSSKVLL